MKPTIVTAMVAVLGVMTGSAWAQLPAASDDAPTLVVVTFANVGGAAENDWVGAGIAESLAAALGGGVHVASVQAAEQRGAARIAQGTHERIGSRLRITALLTDAAADAVLRSALVDGAFADLFALQDALAEQLAIPLTSAPEPAPTPEDRGAPSAPRLTTGPAEAEAPAGVAGFALAPRGIIEGPPPPELPAMVARNAQGQATMRATRLETPIALDGRLDEAVYSTVQAVSEFIQQEPNEGAPATERTDTWIFFDDDTIYIAARCWDSQPERMVANEMRRDNLGIFQNENFAVVLDTFYDRRNAYLFHTNPLGGMFDGQITAGNMNRDWNGVWDVRTDRFENGWTVEIAIPFKTVRFSPGAAQTWGLNLRRIVRWKNEISYLTAVPAAYGLSGIMELAVAGAVVGVEAPASGGNLEVKPYLIADLATDRRAIPAFANTLGGDAGFDVKYGVTQGLTADFTYNTDFAQVEVDEQQVNLTRFSLFFPEKREFFLEGRGVFDFARGGIGGGFGGPGGGGGFFGGGNAPTLFYSRRIGLQAGEVVPILGGGRVTGKVGQFSVGALSIQTDDLGSAGAEGTNFTVARVKRDILRRSAIGAIFTNRSVSLQGDGSSRTYGADATFAFFENIQALGYYAKTETPGRPGEDTSYQAQFGYAADRYGLQVDHVLVEDNFNPEVGFLRRDNFRRTFVEGRFSPRPRSLESVRQFRLVGSIDYILTADTDLLETRTNALQFQTQLENSDTFGVSLNDNYELLLRPFAPSGADFTVPVGGYSFTDVELSYQLGEQRRINGGVSLQTGGYFNGDITTLAFRRGRIAVLPQMSIEPSVSFNWIDTPQGSFRTDLLVTRVNYAFNPRMFFSGLVQYNSASDTVSNNLRFRWEYSPGSELFVVYTEDRDTVTLRPDRFTELRNRGFVIKFNRLFRF